MTSEGGKRVREEYGQAQVSPFARLQPLLKGREHDVPDSLQNLTEALSTYDEPVRLHMRLLGDQSVDHWEVESGAAKSTTRGKSAARQRPVARQKEPKTADVILVLRTETWIQIARGSLSPIDALFQGKLRVGGNMELARRIAQHLSDPSMPFVPPC